jgi:hypothetical protein
MLVGYHRTCPREALASTETIGQRRFEMHNGALKTVIAASIALALAGCGSSGIKMGSDSNASTVATGGAAGESSGGENSQLEKCGESLGTVSLVENQSADWYHTLTGQYRLPPTANLLRLLIQQSNCFVIVERGDAGMRAMNRERDLEQSGEMRAGSKFHKGQMVSSDYAMSPEVIFSDNDTGGIGGAVGGLIPGPVGWIAGAVGARTKTREASAMLTLVDNRSGVQIAASEGSASKTDWGGFAALFGGHGGGGMGGYTKTPQGKVIAGAFMDAYNEMVRSLRNYKAQQVKGGLGKGGRLKVGD